MSKNVSGIKLKILCFKFDYPSLHSREGGYKNEEWKTKKKIINHKIFVKKVLL